tara:strand:+ start:2165 stop:2794 length:630 start_codon:yes stop_codon:yes gene_type:complete
MAAPAIPMMAKIGMGLTGLGAVGQGVSAWGAAKGAISEEEEERLRELERMEAINMLGGDYGAALGKQMTPVQGAMREAREQMSQDVSAQDISGGAYFRGTQAMTEAAGKERASAERRAKADVEREEEKRRAEMALLREKKKMKDQAWLIGLQALSGGAGTLGKGMTDIGMAQHRIDLLKGYAGKGATAKDVEDGAGAFLSNMKLSDFWK